MIALNRPCVAKSVAVFDCKSHAIICYCFKEITNTQINLLK